jgi:hypothetical protein
MLEGSADVYQVEEASRLRGGCSNSRRAGDPAGMVFLDGTSIRAQHKAAGHEGRAPEVVGPMEARLLAHLVAAMAPRRVWSLTAPDAPPSLR